MVLTGALWLSAIFRYFDAKILDGWLSRRRKDKERATKKQKHLQDLARRLNALNARERMWITYCLYWNQQSLSAELHNATAQSLFNKQIVTQGSGSMLNLPFHFPDDVWLMLLEKRSEFVPEDEIADEKIRKQFERDLEQFRKSLL